MLCYIYKSPPFIRQDISKVKTIVNQNETAGRKITAWYGRDDAGNTLSAGMYFYRLTAGGKVFTKKMVLMK